MKTNELLRRYVDGRSESAFEELVQQHIDLVYSSALRQVNGDVPAAQDITQAVFVGLARNAPRLTHHTSLAAWLYTSTRYLAIKTVRTEHRRRSREQEAHKMNQILQPNDLDTTWQELSPLLDDAMHNLSPADREVVLMRYFERLSLAEIGMRLGLKANAANMRIERAVNRLRVCLAKRGVTSTVSALAAVLTARAVETAPARLSTRVSRTSLASAAATGGLTWALLKFMGLVKGNALLASTALLLLTACFVLPKWLSTETAVTPASVSTPVPENAPALSGAARSNPPPDAQTAESITLRIIADDTEEPVPGATIDYFLTERGGRRSLVPTRLTATEQGDCEIPLSRSTVGLLRVESRTDGFVDMAATWRPDQGWTIPEQYTLRLSRSIPVSGLVLDDQGLPVANAVVQAPKMYAGAGTSESSEAPYLTWGASEKAVTDSEGRWRIDRFSSNDISRLVVWATHPDYFTEPLIQYNGGNTEAATQMVAGTYKLKLTRGLIAQGLVVDTDGHPVAGAKVSAVAEIERAPLMPHLVPGQSITIQRVDHVETTNQNDGVFVLTGCRPGTNVLIVEAPSFGMAYLKVNLANEPGPLRFVLQPGHVLRLCLLDDKRDPVTNCRVAPTSLPLDTLRIMRPTGASSGRVSSPQFVLTPTRFFRPDADGRLVWESSPDSELQLDVAAPGFQPTNVLVQADGEEHLVTLTPALSKK